MDPSKNRVALRVWGEWACFTRPEMKAERVSYDVITPSAARGILEAVYWKPAIRWHVESILVLRPIRFTNLRRNELGGRGPSATTVAGYMGATRTETLSQVIETDRQQRAATLLRDPAYILFGRYDVLDPSCPPQKHYEMFKRRAQKGQCHHHPYLGCREFSAHFAWHEGEAPPVDPELQGTRDLGWMLHDIDFANGNQPRFFRAEMVDGRVTVPPFASEEVKA